MRPFITVPLGNQKKVPLGNFPQGAFPRGNVVFKRTMFIGMFKISSPIGDGRMALGRRPTVSMRGERQRRVCLCAATAAAIYFSYSYYSSSYCCND